MFLFRKFGENQWYADPPDIISTEKKSRLQNNKNIYKVSCTSTVIVDIYIKKYVDELSKRPSQ